MRGAFIGNYFVMYSTMLTFSRGRESTIFVQHEENSCPEKYRVTLTFLHRLFKHNDITVNRLALVHPQHGFLEAHFLQPGHFRESSCIR